MHCLTKEPMFEVREPCMKQAIHKDTDPPAVGESFLPSPSPGSGLVCLRRISLDSTGYHRNHRISLDSTELHRFHRIQCF